LPITFDILISMLAYATRTRTCHAQHGGRLNLHDNRRRDTRILRETTMLAYLLQKLSHYFERAEQRRIERELARSSDLCELERRVRTLECTGGRE
jgi:hypothetical protein